MLHSPCWFLDIKFKEYSRTKNRVFKEYSKQVYFVLHCAGFAKSVPDFEICTQSLNYFDTIRTKIQGLFIIFKHFQQNFFFPRAFQAPLKSKIKFQGFSRTSTSSTNPDVTISQYDQLLVGLIAQFSDKALHSHHRGHWY